MNKFFAFMFVLLSAVPAFADGERGVTVDPNGYDCFNNLTESKVVGVWEGRILHTNPFEAYAPHSRLIFHSDGTWSEHHEYYQPAVPYFPVAILITTTQGYWKVTGYNQLSMQVNLDAEFGANGLPNDGQFAGAARILWTGTWNPDTCKVDGPWSGVLSPDYDTSVLAPGAPQGTFFYKKLHNKLND